VDTLFEDWCMKVAASICYRECGWSRLLQNVGKFRTYYMVSHHGK